MRVQLNREAFKELAHTRHLPSVAGTKNLLAPGSSVPGELLTKGNTTPVLLYHHPQRALQDLGDAQQILIEADCGT